LDLKQHETRNWETLLRGRFAIHAGKGAQPVLTDRQKEAVRRAFGWPKDADTAEEIKKLPTGAFLAVADLAECYRIVKWREGLGLEGRAPMNKDGSPRRDERGRRIPWTEKAMPEGDELLLGDFGEGRFAWEKKNTALLPAPLPYRGNQRLWEVPDEVMEAALKEVAAK
jgi:hypothetical protein